MSQRVIRVGNPATFAIPEVRGLFERGFANSPLTPTGFGPAIKDFENMTKDPLVGVFLAYDDGKFQGFGIVILPHKTLVPYPQILHLYSEGKPKISEGLIEAGVAYMKEHGYTKFWALNGSGKSDKVWQRALRKGGSARKLASLMEFEVG